MKRSKHRFGSLVALLALGSPAHAADSISFVISGHRVRIEAPRNCRSASCVSVSIPGVFTRQGRRDRNDDVVATPPVPSVAPPPVAAPIPMPPPPVVPVPPPAAPLVTAASRPAVETVASVPPPPSPAITLAAAATQLVAPSPPPRIEADQTAAIAPASVSPAPEPPPPVLETAALAAAVARVDDVDEQANSPRGDWQTEGRNGWVRIERCGAALCGYVLDHATGARGESVLINMKPKDDEEWTGNIYSRASGETYYARMRMQGSDTLRVEACAIGRLFCSGNDWARLSVDDEKLMTSRQLGAEPHS